MTGCVALRNDVYYVRLSYYDRDHKRKDKWITTGFSGRGAKQKATANIILLWRNNMDINSLDRFIKPQELMFPVALRELKKGKKISHWMWYIFPQLRGLGKSSMAYIYGLSGIEEADAYLANPTLSARIYELCYILLEHKDKSAVDIFGDVDTMKLKSSMTLFALTSEDYTIFDQVLEQFFDGQMDELTIKTINGN
jgi:uncharacterized protein (DUF1810 family)